MWELSYLSLSLKRDCKNLKLGTSLRFLHTIDKMGDKQETIAMKEQLILSMRQYPLLWDTAHSNHSKVNLSHTIAGSRSKKT